MKIHEKKLKVGIIGCTASTDFIISKLLEIEAVSIEVIITLNEIAGAGKSRFKKLSYDTGDAPLNVVRIFDFKTESLEGQLSGLHLDVLLEIGWSLKIPKYILDIPKYGAFGVHNSLLPEFQGPASLNWALIWDFKEWGCTLFHLEEEFDDGDIVYQQSFKIDGSDDINSLFSKSDYAAGEMITRLLNLLPDGKIPRVMQEKEKITKTRKRSPNDSSINWHASSRAIFNLVRALKHPYPNAFSFVNGRKILFGDAALVRGTSGVPGTVLRIFENGIWVATGSGAVHLAEYYLEDGGIYEPKIGDEFVNEI